MSFDAQFAIRTFAPVVEFLEERNEHRALNELGTSIAKYWPADNSAATDFLAMIFYKAKNYPQAIIHARRTAALMPENPLAVYNLAKCEFAMGNSKLALEMIIPLAAAAGPKWIDPKMDHAVYLSAQGRLDEAFAVLEQAATMIPMWDPRQADIKYNLGWHFVRRGEFRKGIQFLGTGRANKIWGHKNRKPNKPKLEPGQNLAGKTVLMVGEGGAGDEIISARFGRTIDERGGRAVFCSHHGLESLLARVEGIGRSFGAVNLDGIECDFYIPGMDAPYLLDTDLPQIPSAPYLNADSAFAEKWNALIPATGKLRIGLRWQGNPLYEQDLYRSVPYSHYQNLLDQFPHFEFYCLQRDTGHEEIPAGSRLRRIDCELKSWEDTAAAISQLDLVITSCTSISHLAGALGKETWVLAPLNPYYVWATPGDNSPWYSSVRLFRQTVSRRWENEIAQVQAALADKAAK